jgi:hypothetical protein
MDAAWTRRVLAAAPLLVALAGPAWAQDAVPGGEGAGDGEAGGGGVMAVGRGSAFGVGVERTLGGIAAATFVYDAGRFHIDGLLGFLSIDRDPAGDISVFQVAGRFFWVVHRTQSADLSLGAGLGVVRLDDDGADETETNIHLEAAAKIRAFLVPNVAISASLGVVVITADDAIITNEDLPDGQGAISLGGQLGAAFGMVYFF